MPIDVPEYVSEAARRGLDWHKEGKSGDGVTEQTLREAREMASGSVSEDKVRRMGPWFQRHRPDMDAPKNKPDNKDFPGAGAVAWALWGGPTSGDIMRTADWAEAKVKQLDEATAFLPNTTKSDMSKITPEAEVAELRTVALALTAERDQMKTKLAEKYQRMCKRCGSILPIADRCACIENDTLPVLAQASKENPVLKTYLVQSGYEDLVLPPPKVEPLPELPPSPKEKEQMKVIQQHKNRLLGKVSMPSSNNDFTKDELSGTMISSHS